MSITDLEQTPGELTPSEVLPHCAPQLAVTSAVCESSPTKRRAQSEMDDIREAIIEVLEEIQPATMRQAFYQLVRIHFTRVAVTQKQIDEWKLPTRPTKTTDFRSRQFDGESIEVDAVPPGILRRLVRNCIERHINPRRLDQLKQVEPQERETLQRIAGTIGPAGATPAKTEAPR